MRRLLPLILAGLLAGCAAPAPSVIIMRPPAVLLLDCEHPTVAVAKNKDLVEGLLAYKLALDLCNKDKEALREWDKGAP